MKISRSSLNPRRLIWNSDILSDKQRIQYYPPFWLLGIKVLELSPDWRHITIRLPQSWIATNVGGTLFGGFQACLADPIAAMSCSKVFPGYSIWTRKLTLDLREPGISDLELRFSFPESVEHEIKQQLTLKGRSTPEFKYGFFREDGQCCTEISASIAIRPLGYKKPKRPDNRR